MGVRRLRREELEVYAELAGWSMAENEVDEFHRLSEVMFDTIDLLDSQPMPVPPRADARLNPWDTKRTAAGSSGGSGAALFYDGIDITIGTDQGGSIRLPASWCGVLGLKPTHSLVPYTGVGAMDGSYDHCGPLTLNVEDMALTMDVIAGKHPDDPRQDVVPRLKHREAVANAPDDYKGVTIGLLKEGWGWADQPGAGRLGVG